MMFRKPPVFSSNSLLFPQNSCSKDLISITSQLLSKNPKTRLGSSDENSVIRHPWFKDIDFTALLENRVILISKARYLQ